MTEDKTLAEERRLAWFMMGVISMGNTLHEDLEEWLRSAGILKQDETFDGWKAEIHREAEAIMADPATDSRTRELGHRLEIWARGDTG